jgi:hypothetical protein
VFESNMNMFTQRAGGARLRGAAGWNQTVDGGRVGLVTGAATGSDASAAVALARAASTSRSTQPERSAGEGKPRRRRARRGAICSSSVT